MTLVVSLLDDLTVEGDLLDEVVATLPRDAWARPTPSPGWTIAHQIAHLAWTDNVAFQAATDPDGFRAGRVLDERPEQVRLDQAADDGAHEPPRRLLARWRSSRSALVEALARHPAGEAMPWFGPPLRATSMATVRLMEIWAHGVDVRDTLGLAPDGSARLRHIAQLGVRTRDFAFGLRGLPAPQAQFRIELAAPDGEIWSWGPLNAAQRVTGSALDFCLLVTQRRHRADLALNAVGPDAGRWLGLAQAFAGPPGPGREPAA